MARTLVICAALLFALSAGNQARAQDPGGVMNMFTAIMGAAIVNNARIEWSKLPEKEASCIEDELRQQGTSVGGLIQNGIVPNDPRIAGIRFDCRTAALSSPNFVPNIPNANPEDIGNLSEKPTFDCGRARSLTARTICLDQAGASADWDLITAYWARYFSLPEGERQSLDQAQQDWLNSLNQKCPREQNPQQCILGAYHRRAAAYRSQLAGDALAESRLTPEQHAQIQQSLTALGFLDDRPDGEFGTHTRWAIRRFKGQSGATEGDFLTADERAQLLQGKLLGAAQPVATPSFDCSRAAAPDEQVICGNPRLAKLDRLVAAGYQYVRARYGNSEASQIASPSLQSRHACGTSATCIEQNQLAAIKQYQNLGAPVPPEERQPTPGNTSQAICRVKDPTGTPLNVRTAPNGDLVDRLTNGTPLQVLRIQHDTQGRDWALIERAGEDQAIGWAFRDYIDCPATAQSPTPPSPPPRIETARLKEARIFLEDTKKFISLQKSVPSISEIAKEAASLQVALNQFDERGAVDAVQRLNDLLKPVTGFAEFEQQQQSERSREEARHLVESRTQGKENEFFIDSYLQSHLGDSTTQPLLSLRAQIEDALKANTIEGITKANEAVTLYVKNNRLSEAYEELAKKFEQPEATPPHTPGTLRDSLTEKNRFLVEGPAHEIILLYNSSPAAPKVWKNVRGDFVFQDDAASICFAQSGVELGVERYIEHYLADRGARKITSASPPCDLSKVGQTTDVIAFQRGILLTSREDYVLALAKLLEADTFRKYETISDYASVFQKRQALSLQIEAELDKNSRKGFGAISVTEIPVACVVTPSKAEWSDGLKELLRRNADVIAPTLTSEWQYVDTSTTDLAFLGLQRHQCGFLLGDDGKLREVMLALRRENIKYAFAPIWWDAKAVDQATFDAHDAIEQEILKKKEEQRKREEAAALQAERDKNKQNQKSEIERKLREANGTKARGLMNYVHDLVSSMAEKRPVKNLNVFPTYSNWLNERFADQWETFNVGSDVADFGTVQWERRPLTAIVVKTIVQQKNRILGKYDSRCYLFGFVNDDEFDMLRDAFAFDCSDTAAIKRWKIEEQFQSRWNAE